jgi:polyhydroxyalkanoate synthesis regulator phasin
VPQGDDGRDDRSALERLLLAGLGAAALTGGRADQLADELARKAGIQREEALALVREVADGWRREAGRLGERTNDAAQRLVRELGLVQREEYEDLELRVAQIEHRLKLLEKTL